MNGWTDGQNLCYRAVSFAYIFWQAKLHVHNRGGQSKKNRSNFCRCCNETCSLCLKHFVWKGKQINCKSDKNLQKFKIFLIWNFTVTFLFLCPLVLPFIIWSTFGQPFQSNLLHNKKSRSANEDKTNKHSVPLPLSANIELWKDIQNRKLSICYFVLPFCHFQLLLYITPFCRI